MARTFGVHIGLCVATADRSRRRKHCQCPHTPTHLEIDLCNSNPQRVQFTPLFFGFFFFLSQKPGQGHGMPRPWAFVSSSVRRDRQLPRHPELCLREHGVQLRTWGARAPRKPSTRCPRSLSAGRMRGRTGVGGLPRGWERPRPHGHLTPRGRQPWPHGEIVRPTRCPSRPAR